MRHLYLTFSLLAISLTLFSQTLIFEDFSNGNMPPSGWTIDAYSGNWSTNASANAGGESPEAKLDWTPQFNGTTRLISPVIDLSGETSVYLEFKHMLDDYAGTGYSLNVATTSGGSGTWNNVWSVSPSGNIDAQEVTVEIINGDVGAPDFQFCIYFSGNSYNIDGWFIDNINLFLPYDTDAALASITTPSYVSGAVPVEGFVKNIGFDQINSLQLEWNVDGTSYSSEFTGLAIDFGDSYMFSFEDLFDFPIGAYELTVTILTVNGSQDENPDNDVKMKNVNVVSNTVAYRPLFEQFTSSTCGPCASLNSSFVPWCQANAEDMTLVKYQMDWPGSGDPYYTEEGGVRQAYYGVSYVPWVNLDGFLVASNVSIIDAAFQEALLRPGLLSIAGTHSLDGSEITVTANVVPFANFEGFKIHIVVFEYITTGNVATNGETEFHHVMMKMLPDAEGTSVDMTDRMPVSITESYDMSTTNVEEMSDLGVAIFIQDDAGYTVYQSAYSLLDATYSTEAHLESIMIGDDMLPGFDPEVLEYHVELDPGNPVPDITGIPVDDNAMVIVEPAVDVPGVTYIDVFAEDHLTHLRYEVFWDGFVDLDEQVTGQFFVFPNPTKGELNIVGNRIKDISFYTITGQEVMEIRGITAHQISLDNLPNGIYLLKAVMEDGTFVTKKINLYR